MPRQRGQVGDGGIHDGQLCQIGTRRQGGQVAEAWVVIKIEPLKGLHAPQTLQIVDLGHREGGQFAGQLWHIAAGCGVKAQGLQFFQRRQVAGEKFRPAADGKVP